MPIKRNLPSFLVVGAYKSGTTALYRYFYQHPEIYMSPIKETNFFALEGSIPNYCGPGDAQAPTNRLSITHIDDYRAQFDGLSTERAIGEASPMYLYSSKAAGRIQHYLPGVRLIVILRQPAARAYSNFLHLVRDGREKIQDFEKVWAQEDKRIQANWAPIWHIRQHGFYYRQLKQYFDIFSPTQIKVVLYEDLVKRPEETLASLFDYVGVDSEFQVDFSRRPNQSGIPKNRLARGLARRLLVIPLRATGNKKMMDWGESISNYFLYKPKITYEQKKEITEFYRQDILKLQSLIDRDLTHWLA
ncbi:sulfotransferase family protein [Leptothoe spongobia]|uniref:Sulfotransferase n=1 Tax=Leptothoe spongobia TAU-MAC 1115 TaxID=1967444 RepID=A0A947GQT4_9CYAN|nr:sulfotransferase [Leptothoe spongobia]MBT9317201.1 sulfotransferase [Leptothoe spongobia TAU-MAC 1115]